MTFWSSRFYKLKVNEMFWLPPFFKLHVKETFWLSRFCKLKCQRTILIVTFLQAKSQGNILVVTFCTLNIDEAFWLSHFYKLKVSEIFRLSRFSGYYFGWLFDQLRFLDSVTHIWQAVFNQWCLFQAFCKKIKIKKMKQPHNYDIVLQWNVWRPWIAQ